MKMDSSRIWFFASVVVALSTMFLLITGSPLLTLALDRGNSIPLGTFITWAGMISLPLSIYWGAGELRNPTGALNRALSIFLRIVLVLAILWVPISYLLAGNLSFSFSETVSFQGGQTAMKWFWRLSYGIGVGSLLILVAYWVSLLLFRMNGRGTKKP